MKSKAAVILGSKGGRSKSLAKAEAARKNLAKANLAKRKKKEK
jgi:hypothetical protein